MDLAIYIGMMLVMIALLAISLSIVLVSIGYLLNDTYSEEKLMGLVGLPTGLGASIFVGVLAYQVFERIVACL